MLIGDDAVAATLMAGVMSIVDNDSYQTNIDFRHWLSGLVSNTAGYGKQRWRRTNFDINVSGFTAFSHIDRRSLVGILDIRVISQRQRWRRAATETTRVVNC